jgi:hypothetical protein
MVLSLSLSLDCNPLLWNSNSTGTHIVEDQYYWISYCLGPIMAGPILQYNIAVLLTINRFLLGPGLNPKNPLRLVEFLYYKPKNPWPVEKPKSMFFQKNGFFNTETGTGKIAVRCILQFL